MVRVLVIDDSAVVRKILSSVLAQDPEIQVVGTAPDPFVGRDLIVAQKPDVLLLDVEMPRMDGLTFLRKVMEFRPMPVIIVSSLTTAGSTLALEALRAGAVEVVAKPSSAYSLGDIAQDLIAKTKAAKNAHVRRVAPTGDTARLPDLSSADSTHKIIAIGASTGGTVAIEAVIRQLPTNIPGAVVAQHMPVGFTAAFAERLNTLTELEIREAKAGDVVRPGQILIAPGDQHMVVERSGALYRVNLNREPKVHRVRPAVDVLFRSVAQNAGPNAIGVILTGMGADGAEGLLEMRQQGAVTIAQDEKSCVVFGMPRAAIELGAADKVLPLDQIPASIVEASRRTEVTPNLRARG